MLQQQEGVWNLVRDPRFDERVLERHRLAVRDVAQVADLECARGYRHRAAAVAGWRPMGAVVRRGGPTCTGSPSATMAASIEPSPSVGWAWMVLATSSSVASNW